MNSIQKKDSFSVWLGPEYERGQWLSVESVHPHPEFYSDDIGTMVYADIGLVKLKDPVKFELNEKYYQTNSICLSVSHFVTLDRLTGSIWLSLGLVLVIISIHIHHLWHFYHGTSKLANHLSQDHSSSNIT